MDILGQYKKESLNVSESSPSHLSSGALPSSQIFQSNGELISMVMRLSGGLIKTSYQAKVCLFVTFLLGLSVSLFILFSIRDKRPGPTQEDLRITPPSAKMM